MPVRLSCPSCNTAFTLPDLPADRRANCPRCGDLFPVRTFEHVAESEPPASAIAPTSATSTQKDQTRRSRRRTVVIVLGMGCVAGVIGGVIRDLVHGHAPSPSTPTVEAKPQSTAIPAVQLTGLRYLPSDTNLIVAVQPGPILAYADDKKIDPRVFLRQAGIPNELFDGLANLGLSLPQIDHLVAGTSLGDGTLVLRLALVLVLRQPLADETEFLHKLKAHEPPGKKRYNAEFAGLPLSLARMSPTVWVFGFDDKDFQAVDRGGFDAGGVQLPPGLAQSIEKEVPPAAALWFAANDESWAEKPALKLLVQAKRIVKKEWLAVLSRGKAGVAAVTFEETPRLRVFVKADDAATGEQIRAYFQKLAAKSDTARVGGSGELAFYDAPVDPGQIFVTLSQFLDAAAAMSPPVGK